ncbi:MAG TPA: pyridoxamine 5'-phosphate oxidase family protein [Acidobacteriaceae bacterium]|nr:pyridoxamine 5'-phosphate oxidase family protein [Acidobacteriaceae bacterium]
MPHQFSTLTFTPSVKAVQDEMGSRRAGDALSARAPANDALSADERSFIALRDSFYMASVTESGWPYVQHRGGPAGFLRVLDDRTLAFADVTGNRQYISAGNLRASDRVALFLMDYPHQARLKILGHADLLPWADAPPWKTDLLLDPHARPERVLLIHLAAFDWNCPQHITPRWTADEILRSPVGQRLAALKSENEKLRQALALATRISTPADR